MTRHTSTGQPAMNRRETVTCLLSLSALSADLGETFVSAALSFLQIRPEEKIKDSVSSERFYFGTLKTSSHFAFAGLSALFRSDCFTGASVCVCFRPGKDE